jgi:hypothetical protein
MYGVRMINRQAIAAGVATLQVTLPLTDDNRVILDVRAPASSGGYSGGDSRQWGNRGLAMFRGLEIPTATAGWI